MGAVGALELVVARLNAGRHGVRSRECAVFVGRDGDGLCTLNGLARRGIDQHDVDLGVRRPSLTGDGRLVPGFDRSIGFERRVVHDLSRGSHRRRRERELEKRGAERGQQGEAQSALAERRVRRERTVGSERPRGLLDVRGQREQVVRHESEHRLEHGVRRLDDRAEDRVKGTRVGDRLRKRSDERRKDRVGDRRQQRSHDCADRQPHEGGARRIDRGSLGPLGADEVAQGAGEDDVDGSDVDRAEEPVDLAGDLDSHVGRVQSVGDGVHEQRGELVEDRADRAVERGLHEVGVEELGVRGEAVQRSVVVAALRVGDEASEIHADFTGAEVDRHDAVVRGDGLRQDRVHGGLEIDVDRRGDAQVVDRTDAQEQAVQGAGDPVEQRVDGLVDDAVSAHEAVDRVGDLAEDVDEASRETRDHGAREQQLPARDPVVARRVVGAVDRGRRRDRAELKSRVVEQRAQPGLFEDRAQVERRALSRVAAADGDGTVCADQTGRCVRRVGLGRRVLTERPELEDPVAAEELQAVAQVDVERVEQAELERAGGLGDAARSRGVRGGELRDVVEIDEAAVEGDQTAFGLGGVGFSGDRRGRAERRAEEGRCGNRRSRAENPLPPQSCTSSRGMSGFVQSTQRLSLSLHDQMQAGIERPSAVALGAVRRHPANTHLAASIPQVRIGCLLRLRSVS